jgi:hypothetical protein
LLVAATVFVAAGLFEDGTLIDFHPEQLPVFALIGALLPIAVWKGEEPFGSGFFWTLPVDRRQHALVKVLVGWMWLTGAVAVGVLWLLTLSLVSGEHIFAEETVRLLPAALLFSPPSTVDPAALQMARRTPEPLLWLAPFTAASATYLLSSALKLGSRYPLQWILGTIAAFFVIAGLAELTSMRWLLHTPDYVRPLILGPYGFDTLITARTEYLKVGTTLTTGESVVVWRGLPSVTQWAATTLLWTTAGLLALWAAASRHGERRR